jgi:argonaute-like protein implicated in RNA metabolism and viral defense
MSILQRSKGKNKKIIINVFGVDLKQIEKELNNPKEPKIMVYNVKITEPFVPEPLINILNNNGYYDVKEGKLYTTRKINKLPYEYEKIAKLIEEKSVTINEVSVNGRKNVIKIYVRDKIKRDTKIILGSIDVLNNIEEEFTKNTGIQILRRGSTFKIGPWNVKILVDDNDLFVFWKGDELYITINVSIEINFDGNMWDHLVKRDIRKLKKMLGTKFRYILDLEGGRERNRVYIVKSVIPKDEYIKMCHERGGLMFSYEDLLKYPERRINEHKENINLSELFKNVKIDGIDNNQAIIEGIDSRGKKFYFPAQYVIPVFDPKIAKDEEGKILEGLKMLVHKYKGSLIKKIANKLWYLKDSSENFITRFDDEARLLVKMYNVNDNKVYNKEARTTSQIISPLKLLKHFIKKEMKKKGINKSEANEIPLPNKVPTILENVEELALIVLVEEDLKENELNIVKRIVEDFTDLYDFLRKIWEKNGYKLPCITYKRELRFERNDDFARVAEKIFKEHTNGMLSYAFIFGRRRVEREDDEESDYYEDLKRALFARNIISQNISVEKYLSEDGEIDEKELGYAFSNIFYDMLGKLGIKLFTLQIDTEYDYIIGVDVGEGEAEGSKIVGSIVIFDRSGTLINMIPVYKTSYPGRETARLGDLLKHVDEKGYITFNGKKILLLRDGRLTKEEQDQLKDFSSKKRCTIEVINVKKRTPFQQLSEEYDSIDWYADMGDFYLLKAHKPKTGLARLVKIDKKIMVFNNSQIEEKPVTLKELKLLRDLAYLNYSTIEGKGGLKLPAPIHYADKLLKALRRGWMVKEDYLKEGMIYFL